MTDERAGEPVAWRYVHKDYAGRNVSRYGNHPERVNGHDPIEARPLYSAQALADAKAEGAREEREKVVRWLRERSAKAINPQFPPCAGWIATAIEKGQHDGG